MPFDAKVFRVLIASPSDLGAEREAIAGCLHDWNDLHSSDAGCVLLPVRWESHAAPMLGLRPQAVINDQIVDHCDILIGAFWTRLGSPTGVSESGTVEEIELFMKKGKRVMLYFSNADVPRNKMDTKQIDKLNAFKDGLKDKGVIWEYKDVDALKQMLFKQLTIAMRDLKATVRFEKGHSAHDANPRPAQATRIKYTLEEYSDRGFMIRGDLTHIKDSELENLGGQQTQFKDGKFWCFSKKRLKEVASFFEVEPIFKAKKLNLK